MSWDCKIASAAIYSIWETQGLASAEGGPVNISIRSLISSFDRTASGSYGTNLVLQNLAIIFLGIIVALWAAVKAIKNSGLII